MSGPKSAAELAEIDGKTPNGSYARALKDLRMAGYVAGDGGINPCTGEPIREERFRISDNYTRFFLHYIEPRRKMVENDLFEFSSLEQLKGLDAKLQNPGFLAKAPENVVAAEKDRAEKLRALIAKLEEQLANMG